jgi:hypothetical protein
VATLTIIAGHVALKNNKTRPEFVEEFLKVNRSKSSQRAIKLVLHTRYDKDANGHSKAVRYWYIFDGPRIICTECQGADYAGARRVLAQYKHSGQMPPRRKTPRRAVDKRALRLS